MFDEILLFVNVIKHGRFLNAAKALGLAQSTVSRKIEALESKLGVILIKRDSKNLELTEKGVLLYDNFKDCEANLCTSIQELFDDVGSIGSHQIYTNKLINDLILFLQVANLGSSLALSKKTRIPQSTISRRIKNLGSLLKHDLLIRGVKLTQLSTAGNILYKYFENYEAELLKKLSPVTSSSNKVSGKLSILLPFTLAHYAITPYLGEFLARYPDLEIVCPYSFSDFNMRKEDYDVALINYLPKQASQKIRLILSFKLILVCSTEYIKKHGILNSIDDFEKHLVVGNITPNSILPPYAKLYHEKTGEVINIRNKFRVRANNFLMAKHIVDSGHGIAGLPFAFIKDELESGKFVRILPELHAGVVNCYLMRNIEESDIRYKVFYKFLQECLERIPQSQLSPIDLKHVFSA